MNRATVTRQIAVSTPIKDDRGVIVGVLVGYKDVDQLYRIVEDIQLGGGTGRAFLINEVGEALVYPDKEFVESGELKLIYLKGKEENQDIANMFQKMVEGGETGVSSYSYKGINKHTGYAPLKEKDWAIGVAIDTNELLGDVNRLLKYLLLITCGSILLGIIYSFGLSNSIVNPIRTTTKHIEQISKLDISMNIENKDLARLDEIGGYGQGT